MSCVEPVPIVSEVQNGLDDENNIVADNTVSTGSGDEGNHNNTQFEGTMDPFYEEQWHLNNILNPGEDLNVSSVHAAGNKGEGVHVAIVDDGLEVNHPDLVANVNLNASYNYLNGSNDPTPSLDYAHGTACAGIVAARDLNDIGVRGVASRASLVGYNLLLNSTSVNMSDAMTRNLNLIDVSSNSWGPVDGRGDFVASPSILTNGINEGISSGRNGKGIVYVWAAGNGAPIDRSNYDGFASHPGVMAVAAIGNNGQYAFYSEMGSNLWVAAPSLGAQGSPAITTTDLSGIEQGYNKGSLLEVDAQGDYTNTFNGTSAAAPMVAGVAALLIKENPNLTYRDVKNIIAKSARKNHPTNINWQVNGAGIAINQNYGFGAVDSQAAVDLAKTWALMPSQVVESWPAASTQSVGVVIPDDETLVTSDISIANSNISKIEYVEVELIMDHADWGNLDITLRRKGAITTESMLATWHDCFNAAGAVIACERADNSFTFGVSRHLDEPADGIWSLEVTDAENPDNNTGTLLSWRLKIYGH